VIASFQPSAARAGIHNHNTHDIAPLAFMDSGLTAARRPGMTSYSFSPASHFSPRLYKASTSGPSSPGISRFTV